MGTGDALDLQRRLELGFTDHDDRGCLDVVAFAPAWIYERRIPPPGAEENSSMISWHRAAPTAPHRYQEQLGTNAYPLVMSSFAAAAHNRV